MNSEEVPKTGEGGASKRNDLALSANLYVRSSPKTTMPLPYTVSKQDEDLETRDARTHMQARFVRSAIHLSGGAGHRGPKMDKPAVQRYFLAACGGTHVLPQELNAK
jgi:hypothetical protein